MRKGSDDAKGSSSRKPPIQPSSIEFASESLLREAVRALLSRIPEVKLVQISHGPQEVGKDIIFYLAGGLGQHMLCACVVKNERLDGQSSASKKGALTILHQAEQCLLNPKKMESGIEIPIQKVFIVTPYDLPETTLNAIFGHLKDRAGKVEIVGGTRLFELLRTYWPDFFSDEFTAIREHLRSTTARLREDRPLEQISINYQLGAPERAITVYYVQPNFHQELLAIDLSLHLKEIIPHFRTVMIPRRGPKSKDTQAIPSDPRRIAGPSKDLEWVPSSPRRLAISSKDLDQCKSNFEMATRIIDFLTDWEYCNNSARREMTSVFAAFLERLQTLREQHTAVDVLDRASTVKELSKNSTLAELTLPETENLQSQADGLLRKFDQLLRPLKDDLSIAADVVRDPEMSGLLALNDPKYRIAASVKDMYQIAPEGLFANYSRTLSNGSPVKDGRLSLSTKGPAQAEKADLVSARIVSFPGNFLDSFRSSVIIVGSAGYGKNSFCRWHALNDAEHFAKGISDCLPAYFPLHEITSSQLKSSFEAIFLENVGESALIPRNTHKPLESQQRVRLYLDGLDEVTHPESRRKIVEMVKSGLARWNNVQVVLTARDYIVGPWLSWLPKFHLSAFTDEQVQELVANWLDKEPDRLDQFNRQLSRTSGLKEVLTVPLLTTLVILVFRLTGNLASSRKRLYEMFVDLLNAGWDLAKRVQRGSVFGSAVKLAVLKRLAYRAHYHRIRHFEESWIRSTMRSALKTGLIDATWKQLLSEMLQDGLLISSGSTFSFAHLSFQEYLAAANLIGDPSNSRRAHVLGEFLRGDDWWQEVLTFYLELSSSAKELGEWIEGTVAGYRGNEKDLASRQSKILLRHIRVTLPELAL